MKRFPVSEVFGPVIQGEGAVAGQRTMFVRLAGCDGAAGRNTWCTFCDTMYAVDPKRYKHEWRWVTAQEAVAELLDKAPYCRFVTLSGGNPALHDLDDLVRRLLDCGYTIAVETQGTVYRPWLAQCHVVTFSPKPPSAGHATPPEVFISVLNQTMAASAPYTRCVLKVVVDPAEASDYAYATQLVRMLGSRIPAYLLCYTSPADTADTLLERYSLLQRLVADDMSLPDPVYTSVQQHVLVHGVQKRGV